MGSSDIFDMGVIGACDSSLRLRDHVDSQKVPLLTRTPSPFALRPDLSSPSHSIDLRRSEFKSLILQSLMIL